MSEPTPRAVFLSYAREDAAAARRIADALRSSGIEVWFDENELRGGDAWDQKIRRQIRDCTLLIAVISAHTQERGEGYFRLEWSLAVERTRLIMEGVPFLVPVAVDDTPESSEMVPEQFLRVQWTRLPGALPTPQFVEQVKRLLQAPRRPVSAGRRDEGFEASPVAARRRFPVWMVGIGAVAALALVGYFVIREPAKEVAAPKRQAAEPNATMASVRDKSIAVLPFSNLSPDKENEFFADGIHADVLANLQNIRELRVVSAQSVSGYRGTTKTSPEIGRELGVAYLLTGKVQRAGDTVRVTTQLIDARTDVTILAPPSYTKKLENIFAIQSEIAGSIATTLRATLSPLEKLHITRRPTENSDAYENFLKGRNSRNRESGSRTALRTQEACFEEAVKLDPKFPEAWGELAVTHALFHFNNVDKTALRLTKAKEAIEQAIALAPDLPEVIRNVVRYHLTTTRNMIEATRQVERLIRLAPNDGFAYSSLSTMQYRQDKWSDAVASAREAARLDPGNVEFAIRLVSICTNVRRYDEAIAEQRRVVAFRPEDVATGYHLGILAFYARGSTREADEFFARLPQPLADSPRVTRLRLDWAELRGEPAEATRLDRLVLGTGEAAADTSGQALQAAVVLMAQNQPKAARARVEDWTPVLRSRLDAEPTNESLWRDLGLMEAILGRPDEALRCARKAVEVGEAQGPIRARASSRRLAVVRAWTGDKDGAIAELTRLLQMPPSPRVYEMKTSAYYFPLRGDPRFEAMLNDPKNNAPLF